MILSLYLLNTHQDQQNGSQLLSNLYFKRMLDLEKIREMEEEEEEGISGRFRKHSNQTEFQI